MEVRGWTGVVSAGLATSRCSEQMLRPGERVGSSAVTRLQGRNSKGNQVARRIRTAMNASEAEYESVDQQRTIEMWTVR